MVHTIHEDKIQDVLCEPLLKEATPSIYPNNPFTVFSLPTTASDREIKKQIQAFSIKIRTGLDTSSRVCVSDLSEIESRLHKPEIRLIGEFFHFWMNHDQKNILYQKISDGLKGRDPLMAIQQWLKVEKTIRDTPIHNHDLAVLSHRLALQVEETPMNENTKRSMRDFFWKKSYSIWMQCIQREEIWSHLRERIREYQDPRLTTGFIRRFRETLQPALLAINLGLYQGYYRKKCHSDAEWHRDFIRSLTIESAILETAFRSSGQYIIDRIEHVPTQLLKSRQDSGDWNLSLKTEFEQILESVLVVQEILPVDCPLRTQLLDSTAEAILQFVTPVCHHEENYRSVIEWLSQAAAIAVSPTLRERIETNRTAIQMQLDRKPCWFCGVYLADDRSVFQRILQPGPWNHSRSNNSTPWERVEIPRCPRCESLHRRQRFMIRISLLGGISLGIFLLFLLGIRFHIPTHEISVLIPIFIVLGIVIRSGCNLERWGIPQGVRPESDYLQHPSIVHLWDSWQTGQTPVE